MAKLPKKLNRESEHEENEVQQSGAVAPFEEVPKLSGVHFNDDRSSEERKLLRGITKDGVLHDTFTFREMDGADEEAMLKGDLRSNPAKIIHVLLDRCVQSIGTLSKKDFGQREWYDLIRSLYVGDQDFMLMTIRAASLGQEIKLSHICPDPGCKAKLTTYVDLDELRIEPFKGYDEVPFELPRGYTHRNRQGETHVIKKGLLRLATGLDREVLTPLFKKNPGVAKTMMLTRLTSFSVEDAPPITDQVMKYMTLRDRNYLQELLADNEFGIDGTIECVCSTCGEEFQGDLTGADFLS